MAITLNGTTGITTPDVDSTDLTATGNFTSRGIDDNATSTAMTLGTSGDLMVGTTSEVQADSSGTGLYYDVSKGTLQVKASGNIPIVGNRVGSAGNIMQFRSDGTTVGDISVATGSVTIGAGDVGLFFNSGGDNIFPTGSGATALSGRDAAIDIGRSAYRFKDVYLSGGVYLGGTGSANKLDDYEEGTWNVNLAGNTTAAISSGSIGHYTKIGEMVYASFAIRLNTNSDTSTFRISGLPFAIGSSENDRGGIAQGWQNSGNDYISNGPVNSNEFHIYDNSGNYYLFSNWSNKDLKATFIYRVN